MTLRLKTIDWKSAKEACDELIVGLCRFSEDTNSCNIMQDIISSLNLPEEQVSDILKKHLPDFRNYQHIKPAEEATSAYSTDTDIIKEVLEICVMVATTHELDIMKRNDQIAQAQVTANKIILTINNE